MNNLQGPRVPVTEQIVGRAGRLIGAPVCAVQTIEIPPDFVGWEFRPGARLEVGIAHASRQIDPVVENGTLDRRLDDDNARRHAYIFALHDWCWGGDGQWLVALAEDNAYYSHDHGWYLPPEGPVWTADSLEAHVDMAHEFGGSGDAITPAIASEVAASLRKVERAALRDVLRTIPRTWPITDDELECVGFFLERRADATAQRLATRFGGRP
jgi:hypothetical protein